VTIERSFTCALAIVIACVAVSAQQDQTPKFRADVNRVLIDVAVSDSSGHAVDSLTAGDFHVFDNNVAQTITSADYIRPGVRLNLGRASKTSAPSSDSPVSSGAGPGPGTRGEDNARKSQFHTVVIDDLNIAANHIASIRDGMTALVDHHLGRDDYFAIVRTGHALKIGVTLRTIPGGYTRRSTRLHGIQRAASSLETQSRRIAISWKKVRAAVNSREKFRDTSLRGHIADLFGFCMM
jgi:VWFA-related protein